MRVTCGTILRNVKMAVNIKDLYGNQAIESKRYVFAEILNKKRLTLFTWCVLAYCVVIFPIRCDFSDFFHSRPSTLKERMKEIAKIVSDRENNHTVSKNTPCK